MPRVGVSPLGGGVLVREDRIDAGARVGAEHPPLLAPVVSHEVRGDPVQPRPHRPRRIQPIPVAEGDRERLGRELVCRRWADPPSQVPLKMLNPAAIASAMTLMKLFGPGTNAKKRE